MDIVQLCEIGMLIAFGFSWPFNICKSLTSGTAKGKSLLFECVIIFGYCVGLIGKYVTYTRTGVFPWSVWFYLADIAMVTIDLCLTLRNVKRDWERDAAQKTE